MRARARSCMRLAVASTSLSPQENRKMVIQRLHHVLLWVFMTCHPLPARSCATCEDAAAGLTAGLNADDITLP